MIFHFLSSCTTVKLNHNNIICLFLKLPRKVQKIDLEPLDLLNGLALGCYQQSPVVLIVILMGILVVACRHIFQHQEFFFGSRKESEMDDGFFVISPNSSPCGPNFLTLLYPNLKKALNQQEKNIHFFKTKNKGFNCSKIYRFNSLLLSCAQSWIFKSDSDLLRKSI